MIAKRVNRDGHDSFRRLAEYIAAASDPGEKLDDLWIVNAGGDIDDLNMAIHDIEATQAQNTRVKGDKSYHLIVSFRDEKPSKEALRDIERHFAEALGFEEHQRVAATHNNTENFHLHIAFNKIHPTSGRAHTPHRDFRTLERVSRAMEEKYGLKVDLGREDKLDADRKPTEARDMEAHSWEQSFFSYVQEHKDTLLKANKKAESWQDLHDAFGKFDLVLKKRGNGLVIGARPTNQHSKAQHIKASGLDRSFSKAALEKRLGPFQAASKTEEKRKPAHKYKPKPITRHRGQGPLWNRYTAAKRKRPSLAYAAFKTWREFLTAEALNDPLAMAIIYSQRKIMEALFSPIHTSVVPRAPSRPPAPSKNPDHHSKKKRKYLDVPYIDREHAKESGAKWDKKQKQWYAPDNLDPETFKLWSLDQQAGPVEIDMNTAEKMGAFTETALTEKDVRQSYEHLDADGKYSPPDNQKKSGKSKNKESKLVKGR